jgi:4-amino-4-deoxy-L-arabinose transferase-like glycosyltransferase
MNKKYQGLICIISACLLLSLLYCPPWDIFYDDKEIFRYFGMVIRRGGIPYRDFFDHKPPLIFLLNSAGLLLGSWGLWILDTSLVLLATLLFFDLGKKYRLTFPWLLPLLFNLVCRNHLICDGIGMTREYTAIFLLISFCLIVGKYRYRYLLLGAFSALTFFMQQDQLLPLAPFLLYAVVMEDRLSFVQRLGRLISGFAAVALPLLGWLALNHSMGIFWTDAFAFNFSWYTKVEKSLLEHLISIKTGMDKANMEVVFLITATLGVSSLFLRNKKKGLTLAALAALAFSFAPEFLTGHFSDPSFYYYLLPLSATLCALLFVVFAFAEDNLVRDRTALRVWGFLLCCSLGYNAVQHATHLPRYPVEYVENNPGLQYLYRHPPGDYQLYVVGSNNFVYAYNKFRILAPSRWIYHHFWFWYDGWDPDQAILKSIENDLLQHHTTYILNLSNASKFRNPKNFACWQSFLERYYEPVALPGVTTPILWKIKAAPRSQGLQAS